jgi:hypothetical protein
VATADPRRALGERKQRRAHPASPLGATSTVSDALSGGDAGVTERPVMLCVRVAGSLRTRVKLAALRSGRPVQEFVGEALDEECRRSGV